MIIINIYKNFIEQFDKNIYENESIDNEELFGLKMFLQKEYFNNNLKINKKIFEQIREELKKVLFKYNFILNNYISLNNKLKKEIELLENEYFELNKTSILGEQFFSMNSLKEFYNNVIRYQIVYNQNLKILDNSIIKSNEELTEIPFNIREEKGSIFIYFNDSQHNIQNIFLEFFNEFDISIFGIKYDDSMVNIVSNINNSQKLYINTLKEDFKGIFITGFKNINGYLKDCKIFDYKKNNTVKNGVIVYRIKPENIKKIFYFSNSETELYKLNSKEYNEFLKLVNKEITQLNKILNIKNKITKNKEYIYEKEELFIVEVFNKNVNYSDKLAIFGSDKA